MSRLQYSLTTSFPAPAHHRLRQCLLIYLFYSGKSLSTLQEIVSYGIMGVTTIFSIYLSLAKYKHQTLLSSQPLLKLTCCAEKERVWNWEEQVSVRNWLKVSSVILGTQEIICMSLTNKLCSWNAEEMIIVFIAAGGLLTTLRFKAHAYFIRSSDVLDTNWQVWEDPRSIIRVTSQDRNAT